MMSVVVQIFLALGILEAVASDPQQGSAIVNVEPKDGEWNDQPHIENRIQPAISDAAARGPSEVSNATSAVESTTLSERPDLCLNPPDPGECRGAFPRYYYNSTLDQCDCFLYGGCDNEAIILSSTWLTLSECTDKCRPGNTEEGEMCKLLPNDDGQNYTQPFIVENPDSSHISDQDFLDLLE